MHCKESFLQVQFQSTPLHLARQSAAAALVLMALLAQVEGLVLKHLWVWSVHGLNTIRATFVVAKQHLANLELRVNKAI